MKLIIFLTFFYIYFWTNQCLSEEKITLEKLTVSELAELQSEITKQISLLDSEEWEKRTKAKKMLLKLIEEKKYSFNYFIKVTSENKSPEVRFSSKEILYDYFIKNVYDPDRKNGFIGLSLIQGGQIQIGEKKYFSINVGSPMPDFPGEKAGVKAGDMIIEVDNNICSRKFRMEEFIAYIAAKKPGDEIIMKLFSNKKVVTKKIILTARPENQSGTLPKKSEDELFEDWYNLKIMNIE